MIGLIACNLRLPQPVSTPPPEVSTPAPPSPVPTSPVPTSPVPTSSEPQRTPAIAPQLAPALNRDRLLAHLNALDFERYSPQGRTSTRRYLREKLTAAGWQVQTQEFASEYVEGVNLIARLGSKPAQVMAVGHYDTVKGSPGADDNGTAIATLLAIAEVLGARHQTGLELVFFDQEEAGLVGSLAFTAQPENIAAIKAVVNLEMLGYACHTAGCQQVPEAFAQVPLPSPAGDFLAMIVDQEHQSFLGAFAQQPPAPGDTRTVPLLKLPIPFKGLLTPDVLRSDHAAFWAKNIGAVMLCNTANLRNPHYHQQSDRPDTLDFDFFTRAAQTSFDGIWSLMQGLPSNG